MISGPQNLAIDLNLSIFTLLNVDKRLQLPALRVYYYKKNTALQVEDQLLGMRNKEIMVLRDTYLSLGLHGSYATRLQIYIWLSDRVPQALLDKLNKAAFRAREVLHQSRIKSVMSLIDEMDIP